MNIDFAEIAYLHIRNEFDAAARLHVHADRMGLIARMHGLGWYARTTDLFDMPRRRLEEFEGGN